MSKGYGHTFRKYIKVPCWFQVGNKELYVVFNAKSIKSRVVLILLSPWP